MTDILARMMSLFGLRRVQTCHVVSGFEAESEPPHFERLVLLAAHVHRTDGVPVALLKLGVVPRQKRGTLCKYTDIT